MPLHLYNKNGKLRIAIIGTPEETADLQSCFSDPDRFEVVKTVNPETEAIRNLAGIPNIDLIVNTSCQPSLPSSLKKLKLPDTDIISSISAELLFCTGMKFQKTGDVSGYRSKVLQSLQEIRRSVFLTKNKEELLKLVLSIALQSVAADTGSIMLTDPHKRTLKIEMAQGLEHTIVTSTIQKIGKGIAGKVARTGKPVLIRGKVTRNNFNSSERTDIVSAVSCPLVIEDETVGVINVNSNRNMRIFDQQDLQFIKKIADFTADVIQTSREYEHRAYSLFSQSVIMGIRDILNLDFPFQERLNLLLMKMVNSFHGKICNFYRFDKESQRFLVHASSSFDLNRIQGNQIRLNDFFTGRVLRNKSPFTFHTTRKSGLKKWFLAQPLIVDNDLTGLLLLHLISDKEEMDRELELMNKIGKMLLQEFSKANFLALTLLNSIKYSALSEITFDLAGIHNIRQVANLIVANACLIMEAESCVLSLYNSVMNCFEPLESFSLKNGDHLTTLEKIDSIIALNASMHKEAVLIEDLYGEGYVGEQIPSRSVISMCLRQNGNIMACLSVFDKNRFDLYDRGGFSRYDKDIFISYCYQATKALNRFLRIK